MVIHPAKFLHRLRLGRALACVAVLGLLAPTLRAEFSNDAGLPNGADLRGIRNAVAGDPDVPVPVIPIDDVDTQYALIAEVKATRLLLGNLVRCQWLIVGLLLASVALNRVRLRL